MRLTPILFILTWAMNLQADQFDTMRLYWRDYLIACATNPAVLAQAGTNYSINQSGHFYLNIAPATISSTASNYWSAMNTNSSSYLWNDLTIQTVSANLNTTFDRLQMMALAWPFSPDSQSFSRASSTGPMLV